MVTLMNSNTTRNISVSTVLHDLVGGLTAAIVALPIALAFGVASGLGPAAGIYGAITCGFFAALFGGTAAQVSGPTGPMTIVVASLFAASPDHPERVFAASIIAGVIQIILARVKAGQLIEYIPYPVISGFMSGIGIIIVVLELNPLLGTDAEGNVTEALASIPKIVFDWNQDCFLIGIFTIVSMYLLPRFSSKLPASLVTLIAASTLASFFNLNVPAIGEIPSSFPLPKIPALKLIEFHQVFVTGIALAVLGSLDSLLTSVVADKTLLTRHDSNQELIGQGIGNIAAGFVGGLPGAGATMRTMVNIRDGGRTKLSGMFHSLVLLVIVIFLGRFASQIPLAVLAGILMTVGFSIIDYRSLLSIKKTPSADVTVMLVVLFLTVFVDLIIAVLVGVCLACALFVKEVSDAKLSEHGHIDTIEHLFEVTVNLEQSTRKRIYTYTFNGPLFFGEVKNFQEAMVNVENALYVALRFTNVPIIDQSGAFALEEVEKLLETRGAKILFVGIRPDIERRLVEMNVIKPSHHCFNTLEEAIQFIQKREGGAESEERIKSFGKPGKEVTDGGDVE